MSREERLEARVEGLEEQVSRLNTVVSELANRASVSLDETPMAITDAKTWKHPETAIHIYEAIEEFIEESPNYVVAKKRVKGKVAGELDTSKEEVRATMKRLIDEQVLVEHGRRVKIAPDAQKIDPEVLFKSNLTHAEERREEALSRGKAVDNPSEKYDL